MNENNILISLPNNPISIEFNDFKPDEKIKIIELGINLFNSGNQIIQCWNQKDWETKIKVLKEKHENESKKYISSIENLEKSLFELKSKHDKEKQNLFQEVKNQQQLYYSQEIENLQKSNNELQTKLICNHSDLEEKYDNKLKNTKIEYESKIDKIEKKYEERLDLERKKNVENVIRNQNSFMVGQDGEDWLFINLNLLFPNKDITDTSKIPCRGDFIFHDEEINMTIETKNYSKNVPKAEVDLFYDHLKDPINNDLNCALFISKKSGIANKSDFEFEIVNNKPIVYLTHIQDKLYHIPIAVKILRLALLDEKFINLNEKEKVNSLQFLSKQIKDNIKKQKKSLDKYYQDQIKFIENYQNYFINVYETLQIKP
jgi:hypothetical protein